MAHVDIPVDGLPNAYPRLPRPSEPEFLALVRRLGRLLPGDVRIRRIVPAPAGFGGPFSALRRHYVYPLSTAPYGVEPHQARFITAWPRPLDVDAMTKRRETVGTARLRRVLPSPRGCYHGSRSAAARLDQ